MSVVLLQKYLSASAFFGLIILVSIFIIPNSRNQFKSDYEVKEDLSYEKPQVDPCLPREAVEDNFLFLTVRTSNQFHDSRLKVLLDTWIPIASELLDANNQNVVSSISIVTDSIEENDPFMHLVDEANAHIFPSYCGGSHDRYSLSCKIAKEFIHYYKLPEKNKPKWFCHFDDDIYVHITRLIKLLRSLDDKHLYYVGKPSFPEGYEAWDYLGPKPVKRRIHFANGAAFCLSTPLMKLLKPIMTNSQNPLNFQKAVKKHVRILDDVMLGLMVTTYLNATFHRVPSMHSHHAESSVQLSEKEASEAITLSYLSASSRLFAAEADPNREAAQHAFYQAHNYYLKRKSFDICEHEQVTGVLEGWLG